MQVYNTLKKQEYLGEFNTWNLMEVACEVCGKPCLYGGTVIHILKEDQSYHPTCKGECDKAWVRHNGGQVCEDGWWELDETFIFKLLVSTGFFERPRIVERLIELLNREMEYHQDDPRREQVKE